MGRKCGPCCFCHASATGQLLPFAKVAIKAWRRESNEKRPKKSLGGMTPSAYAKQLAVKSATLTPESKSKLLKRGSRRLAQWPC
jgi:hypothetical protein